MHIQVTQLFQVADQHIQSRDWPGAASALHQVLQSFPDIAEAHANLAFVLEQLGRPDEATAAYRQALGLQPDNANTLTNLAALLITKKQFTEALSLLTHAITAQPDAHAAWLNLGVLHASLGNAQQAEDAYRRALMLVPDYAKARFNLAYILLQQGRFEEGWQCLASRDWPQPLGLHFQCPRWQGEDLTGKRIIIGLEGGHGDMIQFVRYASLLKAKGAVKVDILCQPALARLLQRMPALDNIYPISLPVPAHGWDYWVPLLSLPFLCQTTLQTIPAHIPYLDADAQQQAVWQARLAPKQGITVGLAWKGNPAFENDQDRSLPSVNVLSPLAHLPGIQLVSLQKGTWPDDPVYMQAMGVRDTSGDIGDFADLAGLIAELGLVISVDTAVAHLAGAMGKPCWLLLPAYKPDWRWLKDRPDTPWYPDMQLFRQTQAGDWASVMSELRYLLQARSAI
ncbi:tetratricopeptide repeat protein [Leeia oryzae]|uniref:tetratricopeptide repeat-containing glycosyltransferase family protein n=1 Tax=Leeia oryzae TaxID=356662 RepID=UPI00037CC853|nr:tetratricopeptide repeat protein [Leeia oryzae]